MKFVLRDDGYAKITDGFQAIENIANEGLFNPDKAHEYLQKIRGELYKLNLTLRDVCLLTPEQSGPSAA
jgi:hypothetical protein